MRMDPVQEFDNGALRVSVKGPGHLMLANININTFDACMSDMRYA